MADLQRLGDAAQMLPSQLTASITHCLPTSYKVEAAGIETFISEDTAV
jgi:hypothetical protein